MRGASGRRDILKLGLATFALLSLAISISRGADDFIIVQSTTSTQNLGLFEHILPIFTKKIGIEVRVVAVGTGPRRGELPHLKFFETGWGSGNSINSSKPNSSNPLRASGVMKSLVWAGGLCAAAQTVFSG
jgi:hypothetical protein